jgi:hypothetical protein
MPTDFSRNRTRQAIHGFHVSRETLEGARPWTSAPVWSLSNVGPGRVSQPVVAAAVVRASGNRTRRVPTAGGEFMRRHVPAAAVNLKNVINY